jgi:SEC-C motif-containing protein
MKCPCSSGKLYGECCKPYHDGALPETPLALMRSRYSAYALGNASYIIATTHPKSPYFEKNKKNWEAAILHFCNTTQFIRLEILSYGDDWVHFAAHLMQGKEVILNEKSQFEKLNGKWLYLKGMIHS